FEDNVTYNPIYAGKKPKPVCQQQNNVVRARAGEEPGIRDEMIAHFCKEGPISRKETIRRAIKTNAVDEAPADMLHIPDELRLLPDGSPFVHQMDSAQHIYYNKATIEKAARNGLLALVADGVRSFQPRQLKPQGQLYTVHGVGVWRGGVGVPCSMPLQVRRLSRSTPPYSTTSGMPCKAAPIPLAFDFEKAAINAAGRVFPTATVQGCAFHLAQAWNRKRDKVPKEAFAPCEGFLRYLKETWYDNEVFSDLWDRYGVEELRTTNLAEAYHR
ncbi:hypothetical protein OESDEN_20680, partial [Oesophagostomum dentatum]